MALADFKPMQERCSNCSFCKWIPFDKVKSVRFADNCPSVVYYGYNTYSARGRFQMALAVVNGEMNYTETMAKVTRACLSCGACDVSCKICRYNLEPLDHNLELKHDVIIKGNVTAEQKALIDSLKSEQTMLPGFKKAARTDWAKGLDMADVLKEPADVLFFAGCKYSYDEKLQETARGAVKLLQKAGVKVGTLGDAEACCGGRAYQMGFFEDFEARAAANAKAIEKAGVKLIVTPCSDCYHAFKRLYPKLGLKAEVLHVVEYLERLINEGKLKFTKQLDLTVTYHDPCHLGRQGEPYVEWSGVEKKIRNQIHTWDPKRPRYNGSKGIYDAPRNILKAIPGVQIAEMERIREYSWCCGAGGGCSEVCSELSDFAAAERIAEAKATGAQLLATACPWCKANFEKAGGIEVKDILELALEAL